MTSAPGLQCHLQLRLGALHLQLEGVTAATALALVGPSGAGKTTTLRLLAGLERRATGTLSVAGSTWQDSARKVFVAPWERRVGWVPQEALLFPHLTVAQQLATGRPPALHLPDLIDWLDLAPLMTRLPRHLSGGERQRVALGRALAAEPRFLLLDEPFSALDRPRRLALIARLRDFCTAQALPFILVSHDERDVSALAEDIWTLQEGRLITTVGVH